MSPEDQRYLAENFLAFFKRDYHRVAELHVKSGWVPAGTRVDEFESAIRSVCEPIFERPLKEISFGNLLLRLFQTARRFNMVVQPQLVLLQKTLLNIEGLGRQIYPDLDLWKTAKPFLENWMADQVGTKALIKGFKKNLPYMAEKLPELPELIYEALKNSSHSINHDQQIDELKKLRKQLVNNQRQGLFVLAGSALFISSVLTINQNIIGIQLMGVSVVTWGLAVAGSFLLWIGLKKI